VEFFLIGGYLARPSVLSSILISATEISCGPALQWSFQLYQFLVSLGAVGLRYIGRRSQSLTIFSSGSSFEIRFGGDILDEAAM